MNMVFSNKPIAKPVNRILSYHDKSSLNNIPSPTLVPRSGHAIIPTSQNVVATPTPQYTETVYYMQTSMLGRLMNSKPCSGCTKR